MKSFKLVATVSGILSLFISHTAFANPVQEHDLYTNEMPSNCWLEALPNDESSDLVQIDVFRTACIRFDVEQNVGRDTFFRAVKYDLNTLAELPLPEDYLWESITPVLEKRAPNDPNFIVKLHQGYNGISLTVTLENGHRIGYGKDYQLAAPTCPNEVASQAPSPETGIISFTNTGEGPMRIFFNDYETGHRKWYADLYPGQSTPLNGYVGNRWTVTDRYEHCIKTFTTESFEQSYDISPTW